MPVALTCENSKSGGALSGRQVQSALRPRMMVRWAVATPPPGGPRVGTGPAVDVEAAASAIEEALHATRAGEVDEAYR